MGDAAMKRDEVFAVLARALAEALAADGDRPKELPTSGGRTNMRVELAGVSLQVSRIAFEFSGVGDEDVWPQKATAKQQQPPTGA